MRFLIVISTFLIVFSSAISQDKKDLEREKREKLKRIEETSKYLEETKKLVTPPLVVHNDLPTNDWTKLFQLLSEDKSYQGVANGYSFYDQCLPSNSLSIGFTASSMHWLYKIPFHLKNHCYHA